MRNTCMLIGIPRHLKPDASKNVASCGVMSPRYSTADIKLVDCARCIKTTDYKTKVESLALSTYKIRKITK